MSKGTDYLREIVRRTGKNAGIASLCSSNELVLKAALEFARDNDTFVLIESTANQVNQYGGYTGLMPADFRSEVLSLAETIGLSEEKVIFGGDHLGPVVFKDKPEEEAMREAEGLIEAYVKAGYEKIHIDTSMRLASDPNDRPLSDEVIARRGARLCKVAEQAYADTFGKPSELIYVVGSEVPVPGGTQSAHEGLTVTSPEAFEATYQAFHSAFASAGLTEAFKRVAAVVVQPGVEFGDDSVDEYDRDKANALTSKLRAYGNIVFEGHSTDYQTQKALKEMVEDGVCILKVGPELTFALREGLFALQFIENELGGKADFTGTLERMMLEQPEHWQKYFTGTNEQIALKRIYSYSDRWRYYASQTVLKDEINLLFDSLDAKKIPLTLLSFFLPAQYIKVREGQLENRCEELVKDKVKDIIAKYHQAVKR